MIHDLVFLRNYNRGYGQEPTQALNSNGWELQKM